MVELFQSKINEGMCSLSIDGSAFDSTQLAPLMESADDGFWDCVLPSVERALVETKEHCEYFTQPVETVFERVKEFVKEKDTILFTYVGDLKHLDWPEDVWSAWMRDHAHDQRQGTDRYYV